MPRISDAALMLYVRGSVATFGRVMPLCSLLSSSSVRDEVAEWQQRHMEHAVGQYHIYYYNL
jgi:hypothetical protein